MTSREHSAGVAVRVFPSGVPGKVLLAVNNLGPEPLERDEAARVLQDAARAVLGWPPLLDAEELT